MVRFLCMTVFYAAIKVVTGEFASAFAPCSSSFSYHLVCLVVKASASRAEDPRFESGLRRDFFRVESYQ